MRHVSWRGKYIGWYRLVEEELGDLVPSLSDSDVMENVSADDLLVIQGETSGQEEKPLPELHLGLSEKELELSVVYGTRMSVSHFENIFRDTHTEELKTLFTHLAALHPGYETRLYRKERGDSKPELVRKYLSSRMDEQLLHRLLEEAEELRKGGRQTVNDQSVYVQPYTPEIHLVWARMRLNQDEFREALREVKPIYALLSGIKTQRDIIRSRLEKPKKERNVYREFVDALNEARKMGAISAERRRELNKRWRDYEDEREELLSEVRRLISPVDQLP
ncbi:hypothetical protein JXL21_10785 [Candidatus Bathyarchaeota archaeon]|nr:hypothetical protein [Candidatus Bathyarchaeota archaeon]